MKNSRTARGKIIKTILVIVVLAVTGILSYKAVTSGAEIEAFMQRMGFIEEERNTSTGLIDVQPGDKSETADEILIEAKEIFLSIYPNVNFGNPIVTVRSEIPDRNAVTQFEIEQTLDENGSVKSEKIKEVNIIFTRNVFTDKNHDEQIYIMLHELAHAAARDTMFIEPFSEGIAEAIARDICEQKDISFRTLFHKTAYDEETETIVSMSGGDRNFYLQYLTRNWEYFENIESAKPYFKEK